MASSKTNRSPPPWLNDGSVESRLLKQKVWRPTNVGGDWFVFAIVGREGTGKSLTCASILESVDPSFTAERVFFDPADFLEFVHDLDKDERRGTAVMLDESGVGMGVRTWHDSDQVQLNKVMQTARDDKMIIGLTLPRLGELDSQFRGRLHAYLETTSVEKGNWAAVKWKNIDPTRDEHDKLYKKYPRLRVNGRESKVRECKFGPPSPSFIEAYEARKQQFKQELYEDTLGDMSEEDEEDLTPKEIAERIDAEDYIKVVNGGTQKVLDKDLIAAEYDLGHRTASRVKSLLMADVEEEVM
jgi:hypothetical protein